MSHVVWRIATDTPSYEADDLTGAGAKSTGGRWNEAGVPVVYASETRALACIETIAHLNGIGWDALPAGRVSIAFGTNWIGAQASALLVIPSIVVPEEFNVLINPRHPDSARITAAKVRKWTYDPRFGPG